MFKNLLYNLNLYAQIVNILYVRKVFKEVVNQDIIQNEYYLTNAKGNKIKNPILSRRGHILLELPLPDDIDNDQINDYVMQHSYKLIDWFVGLDLFGLVIMNNKVFINKYTEAEQQNENLIKDFGSALITAKPDYNRLKKSVLFYIIIFFIINEVLNYFGIIKSLNLYEYLLR